MGSVIRYQEVYINGYRKRSVLFCEICGNKCIYFPQNSQNNADCYRLTGYYTLPDND